MGDLEGGRWGPEQHEPLPRAPVYGTPHTLQPLPGLCPYYHVSISVTSNLLKTLRSLPPFPCKSISSSLRTLSPRSHTSFPYVRLSWEKGGEPPLSAPPPNLSAWASFLPKALISWDTLTRRLYIKSHRCQNVSCCFSV